MNALLRRPRPERRPASLEPLALGTYPASLLALIAAGLLLAGCLPAAVLNAQGRDPVSLGSGVAVAVAVAALILRWPQHVTALIALLLLGAAYLQVSTVGWWTLPLYVLAAHGIYVLLALSALAPRSARFTRQALLEAARAAAAPQLAAQLLSLVVLLLSWWAAPAAGTLGAVAGIVSAGILMAGAWTASRVARRPENPN
ncbi:MAG: hypothetical protein ACTHWW_02550 [Arthrobacter sp.]|uniref:hypothetical protein n=1 Tax=unclassified Arthrobacter TaxID=235627 RepID=UPI00264ED54F|nr:hypothetical protein [Micrococcaceae bacterium]MDN5812100.1 hypothetical protein [Micrococcaceae bacterium]MDN5824717.1 hypothetical protein [Micrococcaceae bacterium]MDN5879354.1 hypothetical protein [Micrococcaceae bacterium]MDN5887513.1 hypothetical protein [Micrococcaceae bacterium]